MRLPTRVAIGLFGLVLLPGMLSAQGTGPQTGDNPVQIPVSNDGFGTASGEFLLMGSGARGMALGTAFSTIVDDVNSLYYNPANMPLMDGVEAQLTLMPYFADTDYYWAGLAFPFSDGDFGFGVFLGRFGFSDAPVFTESDPENRAGETFGVDEVVAGLSFAHAFIDRFTAGMTVKFINDNLATGAPGGATARTAAVDFGTNYHSELLGKPIALSFVIQNLGGGLKHDGDALQVREFITNQPGVPDQNLDPPVETSRSDGFSLPRYLRASLAYDPVSNDQLRLTLMAEVADGNQQSTQFGGGAEFAWSSQVSPIGAAARGSWYLQPDERKLGCDNTGFSCPGGTSTDGLALGGGLWYTFGSRYTAKFDYAWRDYGAIGNTSAFSFSFGWR